MSQLIDEISSSSVNSTKQSSGNDPVRIRRQIILHLKNSAAKLTPFLHANVLLDESNTHAVDLCTALEICFFYGIRVKEFGGRVPLWGLLERLEALSPPCIPLRNSVGAVASIHSLRSPLAKARGWIRQVLNNKGSVEASIQALVQRPELLKSFFLPQSIFLQPTDVSILVCTSHVSLLD